MTEQVYVQAKLLAGVENAQQLELLRIFCQAAVTSLTARLRAGITPADCNAEFVASASLFALASLSSAGQIGEVKLGDVTIKRNGVDTASQCLHNQAALIMAPYVKDSFCFLGV